MQPTDIKDYACCTKEMAGNILQARVGAAVAVHKRLDYCDSGNRMRGKNSVSRCQTAWHGGLILVIFWLARSRRRRRRLSGAHVRYIKLDAWQPTRCLRLPIEAFTLKPWLHSKSTYHRGSSISIELFSYKINNESHAPARERVSQRTNSVPADRPIQRQVAGWFHIITMIYIKWRHVTT